MWAPFIVIKMARCFTKMTVSRCRSSLDFCPFSALWFSKTCKFSAKIGKFVNFFGIKSCLPAFRGLVNFGVVIEAQTGPIAEYTEHTKLSVGSIDIADAGPAH